MCHGLAADKAFLDADVFCIFKLLQMYAQVAVGRPDLLAQEGELRFVNSRKYSHNSKSYPRVDNIVYLLIIEILHVMLVLVYICVKA